MTQNHPQRKNLRLPHYNYADEGAYYVTICTDHKLQILCNLAPPALEGNEPNCHLTPVGHTVEEMILAIPGIDKYVVMPNHIHMIVLNRPGDTALSRKLFAPQTSRLIRLAADKSRTLRPFPPDPWFRIGRADCPRYIPLIPDPWSLEDAGRLPALQRRTRGPLYETDDP